jgi:hypothetical protein
MALAAERSGAIMAAEAEARIEDPLEELLRDMLFVDAVPYTAPISGVAAFVEQFTSRAVRDSEGRSLRDLDLTQRLFRYPFSYLVYSAGFDALPTEAKTLFYRRLADVLRGTDTSAAFAAIAPADRAAILAILRETKPEFAALLSD